MLRSGTTNGTITPGKRTWSTELGLTTNHMYHEAKGMDVNDNVYKNSSFDYIDYLHYSVY
eukprot:6469988-Amphidinium_carterae.3